MLVILLLCVMVGSMAYKIKATYKKRSSSLFSNIENMDDMEENMDGGDEIVRTFEFLNINDTTLTVKRKMSWPLNMFDAPDVLDGTLAGDAGFDPLGVAKDKESLFLLREAEIKHARLAMLAAVGWPISELYHYQLSVDFGLANELAETGGRAPSVLNGGLDNLSVLFSLGLFVAVGGVLEFELMRRRKEVPTDLRNFFDMWCV